MNYNVTNSNRMVSVCIYSLSLDVFVIISSHIFTDEISILDTHLNDV